MKQLKILEALIALSMVLALVIPLYAVRPANAIPLQGPEVPSDPMVNPIVWDPTGQDVYNTLSWNPEWLLVHTDTTVDTATTLHITGLDQNGANIEAVAKLYQGEPESDEIPFVDPHSLQPVTFTKITGIFQQNGTHCNSFDIKTYPLDHEQFLGMYYNGSGALGGYWTPTNKFVTGPYIVGGTKPTIQIQDVPVQPVNPEPIKILINWEDFFGVLQPVTTPPANGAPAPGSGEWKEGGAKGNSILTIEGLSQNGSKLLVHVTIHQGDYWVNVDTTDSDIGLNTFSDICKVWGGYASGDQYYIFTHPMGERNLFEYYIRIHHLTLYPSAYDLIANPGIDPVLKSGYPGVTPVALVLQDLDNHTVYAPLLTDNWPGTSNMQPIVVNWWTSGGEIQPSYSRFTPGSAVVWVNLTADTNARTIKIEADANVPTHGGGTGLLPNYEMNLMTWTEITFDGINSVFDSNGPMIHPLQYAFMTADQMWHGPFNATPEPPLAEALGGPTADSASPPYKLNGPIYEVSIPLYPGCNLISSPVHPFLSDVAEYYPGWPGGLGIPMDILFNMTSATESLEAIWWYNAEIGEWNVYIPGVTVGGTEAMFVDGVGYWIKAEKACTLEISGVEMENAPFVPSEYTVYNSWNLMGVTSVHAIPIQSYFESLNTGSLVNNELGTIASAIGPVWVFDAQYQSWQRDPDWLWPTFGLWANYKLAGSADFAP